MSKYLFVVQSSITEGMAMAVINKHQWAPGDCMFLKARGYEPQRSEVKTLDISPYTFQSIRWKEGINILRIWKNNRKNRKALEQLLDTRIKGSFTLFIPHLWSYQYWILMEHRLCRQYAFVEEGTLSYFENLEGYRHRSLLIKRFFLRFLVRTSLGKNIPIFPQPMDFQQPKYGGCYGISMDSFPTLPEKSKHLVTPVFTFREEYRHYKHVLIAGPYVEFNFCSLEEYRAFKTALLAFLAECEIDTLYVKFHPQQYVGMESIRVFREIINLYKEKIKVIELPRSASPEEIAFSSQANFYLGSSSVSIYAAEFGCRVFSYGKPLIRKWPEFRKLYDRLPAAVKQKMTMMDFQY